MWSNFFPFCGGYTQNLLYCMAEVRIGGPRLEGMYQDLLLEPGSASAYFFEHSTQD